MQLTRARRIAALRERRSERQRRDAAQQVHYQASQADAARAALHRRTQDRVQAEQMFTADPGDPQAQVWRAVSCAQEQSAARVDRETEQLLITACDHARTAQMASDRDRERTRLIDQRIAAAGALKACLIDEREADDLQGRRS